MGEKYQVMLIVPKKVEIQKSRSNASKPMNFYEQEKQRQEEFAVTEVGFPVCNDGNRVRKFAMPERRNGLQCDPAALGTMRGSPTMYRRTERNEA